MCDKNAEQILEELQHKEADEMANAAEDDFRKLYGRVDECISALLENRIYLWDNRDIFKTSIIGSKVSIDKVSELIEGLHSDEDIKNSKMSIDKKFYEEDKSEGFAVICPDYKREDIPKVEIEIVTSVSEYIEKVIYKQKEDTLMKAFYQYSFLSF